MLAGSAVWLYSGERKRREEHAPRIIFPIQLVSVPLPASAADEMRLLLTLDRCSWDLGLRVYRPPRIFLMLGLSLLSFFPLATAQNLRSSPAGNETLGLATGCPVQATCYSGGTMGVCVSRSSGCCRGTFNSGNLCPGSNDIQCCYDAPCSTSHGGGTCMQTSLCKSQGGVPDSGNYCDGPADLQCCVKGGSGKITRDEVIARSQDWVNRRIPYSQTDLTGAIVPLLHVLTSAPSLSDSLSLSMFSLHCCRWISPRLLWHGVHGLAIEHCWWRTLDRKSAGLPPLSLSYHLPPSPSLTMAPRRRSVTRSADLSWLEEISF
jgi:hypothetical protein